VWGYEPARSRLLQEQGRSTPAAEAFAVERGWNAARSGAWAIELALSVPLSWALAALEPVIRDDLSVIGYGGRNVHREASGSPRRLLPPPLGSAASHSLGQIPPPTALASSLPQRLDSGGTADRDERIDPTSGQAVPSQSEALKEQVSAAIDQARSLCQSLATAIRQIRALRSQLVETGGEWHEVMAKLPPLSEKESVGRQPPAEAPDLPGDGELSLPGPEFNALNEVVTHAHDLASAGCLSAGYTVLLAGRHRAEDAAAAGMDWAPTLIGIYALALENYIWRYGVNL
jgi:hypothetical protein